MEPGAPSVASVSGDSDVLPQLDARRDALVLDIDGTIIDIAPTPESVIVPESLRLSLSRLCERLEGALALSSGRTIAAIDELFAPLKFVASGCHGAELRLDPHGHLQRCAAPLSSAEQAAFADIARLDPRIRIEDKVYTFAIHYREVPELEDTLFAMVNTRVHELKSNLEVMSGKAVIEIKEPGFNKGTGLRRIMDAAPFAGRRPVFLGDDVTDEDAFAALPEFSGLGISVGRLLPGASRSVRSPSDVRNWLARMVDLGQTP
jgi:trehalose 6-phosphate phosphatase